MGAAVESSVKAGDQERIVKYTAIVRKTLGRFRHEVIKRHTRQLASLILDCFRSLLRKEDLITDLKLILDYQIVLTNGSGNRLLPERLSAGEPTLGGIDIMGTCPGLRSAASSYSGHASWQAGRDAQRQRRFQLLPGGKSSSIVIIDG